MKKDIDFSYVEGIKVAIVREFDELQNPDWKVHIINYSDHDLRNVMVVSKGYGKKDKEVQETSTFRHFVGDLKANSSKQFEKITEEVFHLFNEFWVSFYIDKKVFDKKYIFVPGSIVEDNLIYIKMLDQQGILHD